MEEITGLPVLGAKELEVLAEAAVYAAKMKGILMNKRGSAGETVTEHAPFSLLPTPFNGKHYDYLLQIQPAINHMVNQIANSPEFIFDALKDVVITDDFTKRMLDLYRKKLDLKTDPQPYRLGLFRTDYMMDTSKEPAEFPRMVEINTISVSFAPFGSFTSELHRHLLKRHLSLNPDALPQRNLSMPVLKSYEGIVGGIKTAHEHFVATFFANNKPDTDVHVLMIVQQVENNQYDQRFIESLLYEKHGIKMQRRNLNELHQQAYLDPKTSHLYINAPYSSASSLCQQERHQQGQRTAISVAYYRAGYTPADYPSDNEWAAREMIEFSTAIKAPSIEYHLVGTKKIQQVISDLAVLAPFFGDDIDLARQVHATFTGLYALDDTSIARVIDASHRFVLKPQREGGGNNFYGDDIPTELAKLDTQEKRDAFILMDRIVPKAFPGYIVTGGKHFHASLVSELGIFGVYFGTHHDPPKLNAAVGTLLRSKSADKDDGGVAAGVAILDSPLLY